MRRFKGFTLTELMVALAVVGIIVAVITPILVKTRPNKNKMMVKKSFYTTEHIVNGIINDENIYPDMRDFCRGVPTTVATEYCAYGLDYKEPATYDGLYFTGEYKFAALFKEHLSVKGDVNSSTATIKNPVNPSANTTFYPIFYSSDGIKWDLTGTRNAWKANKGSVGTFDTQNNNTAGIGTITIDVNGDEAPNAACTAANEDCDQYQIQILANGKMRINPAHTRAVNYVTINTAIRDQ